MDAERLAGRKLRVLAVPIDPETNRERISLVPVKAAAGYLGGYGDIDFVEALPEMLVYILNRVNCCFNKMRLNCF